MHLSEAMNCQHCPCPDDGGRCCYCQFTRTMLAAGVPRTTLEARKPVLGHPSAPQGGLWD